MNTSMLDKATFKGYLASYSKKGWLWLSKLCEIDYCKDCDFAAINYNHLLDRVEISPFNSGGGWIDNVNAYSLLSIHDNGVIMRVLWLRQLAEARDLHGQYIAYYDKSACMIYLNLKERIKKNGK